METGPKKGLVQIIIKKRGKTYNMRGRKQSLSGDFRTTEGLGGIYIYKNNPKKYTETYACVPTAERVRGILIAGNPKSNRSLYCNAHSIVIRSLSNPLEASIYGEHGYAVTVARLSPNGEWVASSDVSGTLRI